MKFIKGLRPEYLSNAALLEPLKDKFTERTAPVSRWLARQYQLGGLPPELPSFGSARGALHAIGIGDNKAISGDSLTWSFMMSRDPSLRKIANRDGAWVPRTSAPWPFDHPVLRRLNPGVWAASYHPHQPKGSPLLKLHALDELTAWTYGLTDTVDEVVAKQQLDEAICFPGFRIWVDRLNILPLPIPKGAQVFKVMETRYEILDSPLSYPLLLRGHAKLSFVEGQDLMVCPRFKAPGIPYSNGKVWSLVVGRPDTRWTLMSWAKNADSLAQYRKSAPYLEPRNLAHEISVAGVYFRSLKAASLYFRLPYETVKSRLKSGKDLETVLGLIPLYFESTGYKRSMGHVNHWHKIYAETEDYE